MHEIDLGALQRLPASVREGKARAAIRRKRDPRAIRRPRRAIVTAGARGERLRAMRANVERPEIGRAVRARRDEHDLLSVPREGRLIVVRRTVGEPFEAGAVRLHPIQVCRAVALGRERDPAAIRRPRRVVVDVSRARERMLVAAVGVGDEQSDLFRDGKHPREEDLLRRRLRGCRDAREKNKADRDTDPHESSPSPTLRDVSGGQKDTSVELAAASGRARRIEPWVVRARFMTRYRRLSAPP